MPPLLLPGYLDLLLLTSFGLGRFLCCVPVVYDPIVECLYFICSPAHQSWTFMMHFIIHVRSHTPPRFPLFSEIFIECSGRSVFTVICLILSTHYRVAPDIRETTNRFFAVEAVDTHSSFCVYSSSLETPSPPLHFLRRLSIQ